MRKKTEIVLGNANLTALLSVFEALKACFGEGLTFCDSTIRQRDRTSLDYEVQTSGIIPARNLDSDVPGIFIALVTLTLREEHFSHAHFPTDSTRVQIIGSNSILKLKLHNRNGIHAYLVSEESKQTLDQLKKRMCDYYRSR